ncbi:uncharacterized protein FA14DRAFT_161763 [Meira miltonrushii]|uniref:Uncharacterized protein n=1 Tax=Meira miltonrushii TaxID=1280837 RepID=A0A316VAQ1_9BASI|nr:uncharacterized protein FA14DRAFT_161763 [Meira miltonrushii]PWN34334.1 hypothetical protein FA14DRAFT_161763 [Meira miltonrushii]
MSMVLSHLNASLDASSYIIAMGIVDILTFGAPVQPERENKVQPRGKASNEHDFNRQKPGRYFAPPKQPRRAASDPGWTAEESVRSSSLFNRPVPVRACSSLDSELKTSPSSAFTFWKQQRRVGSHEVQSDHTRRKVSVSHSSSDSGLHHYQKKILSQQMQRTMRIQPYVRATIIISLLASWFFFSMFLTLVIKQGPKKATFTTAHMIFGPALYSGRLASSYAKNGLRAISNYTYTKLSSITPPAS